MPEKHETSYEKQVSTMRAWLLGREYHTALTAMEFAKSYHTGMRKDGKNPEFSHQMFIAFYIMSLSPMLQYPEETLATAFLHDICEDYDVSYKDIEKRFGLRIRNAVELITKKKDGVRIPDDIYYARMADDEIASVVKGVDRSHNIHSMHATDWPLEKMQQYLDFVFDKVLPMLKVARRQFPKQQLVYQNLKSLLLMQAMPIQEMLLARSAVETLSNSSPKR